MIEERYDLVIDRIREIWKDPALSEPFCSCFVEMAAFVFRLNDVFKASREGRIREMSLEALKAQNDELYRDILGEAYKKSYLNPGYMVSLAGKPGCDEALLKYICFLAAEIRGLIPYAFEGKQEILTIYLELFVETHTALPLGLLCTYLIIVTAGSSPSFPHFIEYPSIIRGRLPID